MGVDGYLNELMSEKKEVDVNLESEFLKFLFRLAVNLESIRYNLNEFLT